MTKNFALIGAGGYIAPRHLKAIRDTGNRLVAAVDPKDSVGILDQFSYDVRFITEIERFDRHLEKLRRGPDTDRIHYVSICSPNYLHDAHCRLAMRVGADVICEKPLVINPWNLEALQEIEAETHCRVYTILQLRVHPALLALKERLEQEGPAARHDVVLSYITSRGNWYHVSWKGQAEKSGGVATNIGVHFFDLLIWLFGPVQDVKVYRSDSQRMSGSIELERARGDVPDYALMLGVPAKRRGWMSRHGFRLPAPGPDGTMRCPDSGWRYIEEDGILRCLDWPEDQPL